MFVCRISDFKFILHDLFCLTRTMTFVTEDTKEKRNMCSHYGDVHVLFSGVFKFINKLHY